MTGAAMLAVAVTERTRVGEREWVCRCGAVLGWITGRTVRFPGGGTLFGVIRVIWPCQSCGRTNARYLLPGRRT